MRAFNPAFNLLFNLFIFCSYEYSSNPSILSIKEEVSYPLEVTDFQARRMVKTKSTPHVWTPIELLSEGTTEGNSASGSQRLGPEVLSASSTSSLARTSASSSSDTTSASSSSDRTSANSSSHGMSASSPSRGAPRALGRAVLKKKGGTSIEPVFEIVANGLVFSWGPSCLDPLDGPSPHFPHPKVTPSLKRTTLEKKYLLPVGYSFVIPKADATVNEPPQKWRLKRWLTTCGKPSNGIGGVSHALRVHSRKTIGIYVRTLFYPRRRRLHTTLNCPKIVKATFYAMLLNDAVGLGMVNGFIAADLRPSFEGLRWTSFES
ncbi:hypothetical protein Cgig2_001156 [Carnegiea gigantea]|uniref:Uncharacterized protein n=1 Tax=Carnegiea gigantea TaxID=171969 RepID=A0A9Q1K3J3_9CARY|nr:hypothetical protein Cgig2_001156 [Carnegiea gigantea]